MVAQKFNFMNVPNFERLLWDCCHHHVYTVAPPTGSRKQSWCSHVDDRVDLCKYNFYTI